MSKEDVHRREHQRHRNDARAGHGPGNREGLGAPWGGGRDPWGHGGGAGRGGDWGYDPRLVRGGGPHTPPSGPGGRPPPFRGGYGRGGPPPGPGVRGFGGGGFGRGRY